MCILELLQQVKQLLEALSQDKHSFFVYTSDLSTITMNPGQFMPNTF